MDLKQWVPSQVCLSCDGCCRFKEKDSFWRPKITGEEIKGAHSKDLLAEIYRKKGNVDASGRLKAVETKGHGIVCFCLNPDDNHCRVYGVRPFECKLYPFVLMKKNHKTVLAVHHHCPYVVKERATAEFTQYVDYLKDFFVRQETLGFLQRNSSLAGEYPGFENELEELFTVC